ncbi:MAG TPA: reverse transcriptase domain-containing protein [Ktedonobacteraceae bacterium]
MQIAKVQASLARKALYQPNTRFADLFNLVIHPHWLWIATESVLSSQGASVAGVDGLTREDIKGSAHLFAEQLAFDLKAGSYQPQPVKWSVTLRADGQQQPGGNATLRDCIVQEACRMVLEPIMESHFLNCSTGARPVRHKMDAISLVAGFARDDARMWWAMRGEIATCFEAIPHSRLQGVLKQYIQDKKLLALLATLLHAGVARRGKVVMSANGVLSGGLLLPLLVNVYLHELDKLWWSRYGSLSEAEQTQRRQQGLGNVQFVRHLDSFVVLTNGDKAFAQELSTEFTQSVHELGLTLDITRTAVVHFNDGFDFLGFRLQRVESELPQKSVILVKPVPENITRLKDALRALTGRASTGDDPAHKLRAINALARSWADYYCYANASDEFGDLCRFIHMRVYYWLKARHSNLSARESVKKHVLQTYLTHYTPTRKTWGIAGVKLVPIDTIEHKRYSIHWPEERNPYLQYSLAHLRVTDEVPLPDPTHSWRGHAEPDAYAVARLERLDQIGHRCEECASTEGVLQTYRSAPPREHGKHRADNLRVLCEGCYSKTYSGGRKS